MCSDTTRRRLHFTRKGHLHVGLLYIYTFFCSKFKIHKYFFGNMLQDVCSMKAK